MSRTSSTGLRVCTHEEGIQHFKQKARESYAANTHVYSSANNKPLTLKEVYEAILEKHYEQNK